MNPGYFNFDPVSKGDIIASDSNGDIAAPADGHLLMPLYQLQGDEGFFIVQDYAFPSAF
jgi:succinylglutamate desuccinylase